MNAREFEREYRRLYLPLGMFALRITGDTGEAEDLVNGAFAAVWSRIAAGKAPDNLKAYMYRAVRNRAMAYAAGRTADSGIDELGELIPDEEVDTSERDARLWRELDALPGRCREVFLLSKRDGLSNAGIAEELGISVKTVENQMTKAYARLRRAFGITDGSSPSSGSPLGDMHCFFLPFL